MYTDVYTGSLQTQSYIQFSHKPLRKSTKQSHLDHLHHDQESDLDPSRFLYIQSIKHDKQSVVYTKQSVVSISSSRKQL